MSIFKKKINEKDKKKSQIKEAKVDNAEKKIKKAVSKLPSREEIKPNDKEKQSMKELYEKEGGSKKTAGKKGETGSVAKFDQAYRFLIKPLVTEKASKLGAENKYAFVVSIDVNKISVSKAIEQVYGIKPIKINIVNIKGKRVRSRRAMGKRKDWRKAIVTLPKGKNINIYEGV